jgi:FkbM family methyltransferase
MTEDPVAALEKLRRRHDRNMRTAHAKGLLQGICSMLRPGDLAIDCGANVGAVTGPLAATGAEVICFEPDPFAFSKLQARFADTPNVALHNAAVGVAAGHITLKRATNFADNPKGASVKSTILDGGRGIDDSDGIEVELIDFPAFLARTLADRGEIAFLKIDIEGAELDILETMERDNLFSGIRLTVAETHERKFKSLRPRFKALKERIGERYPREQVNLDWI